jgi:hypothetical protein
VLCCDVHTKIIDVPLTFVAPGMQARVKIFEKFSGGKNNNFTKLIN